MPKTQFTVGRIVVENGPTAGPPQITACHMRGTLICGLRNGGGGRYVRCVPRPMPGK
jgi:hypothetical protein